MVQEDPQSGAPQKAAEIHPKILALGFVRADNFGAIRNFLGRVPGGFKTSFECTSLLDRPEILVSQYIISLSTLYIHPSTRGYIHILIQVWVDMRFC